MIKNLFILLYFLLFSLSGHCQEVVSESGDNTLASINQELRYLRANKLDKYSNDAIRYYHLPITSVAPGASGATWVEAGANNIGGWQLNADGELLQSGSDIHDDWDGESAINLEFTFAVNIDNTGGTAADTMDMVVTAYYISPGETATRSQAINVSVTVGACAQYTVFSEEIEIDPFYAGNPVRKGDQMWFVAHLDTGASDVDDIIVNSASLYYYRTHHGMWSSDK